jgi:hypothetical protein
MPIGPAGLRNEQALNCSEKSRILALILGKLSTLSTLQLSKFIAPHYESTKTLPNRRIDTNHRILVKLLRSAFVSGI